MRILGIDEAGRGSVLGPLVVGSFLWQAGTDFDLRDPSRQAALREAGADDSKALSARRREGILPRLLTIGQVRTIEIEPAAIDAGNLNRLEEEAIVELTAQACPDVLYLDAPVHPRGIPALVTRLGQMIASTGTPLPRFVVEPKADSTWPVVGAASIAAKLRRDGSMHSLREVHGPQLGSGYPSDPLTRAWLSGLLQRDEPMPPCVRTRWGTLDVLRQQRLI